MELLDIAAPWVATAVVLLAFLLIAAQRGGDYSGDPVEEDEQDDAGADEGAEWDRARDQWIDEQNGVI